MPCPSLCNDSCWVGQTSENCAAVAAHRSWWSIWVRPFLDKVVDMPVVCNDRGLRTVKVPQIQFIAGVCGHSSSQQRREGVAAVKFFVFFSAIFRAPPGRVELCASFQSPRWRAPAQFHPQSLSTKTFCLKDRVNNNNNNNNNHNTIWGGPF